MKPRLLSLSLLLPVLCWAAAPREPLVEMSRGEFQSALKLLDTELKRTTEPSRASELQLLRAHCFNAIGKPQKARAAVEQALRQDPEVQLPAPLENPAMTELIESVRASLVGELSITGGPPDADVLIDGRPAGPPPLRITVSVGRRHVELMAKGFEPVRKQVVVRTSTVAEVSFSASELRVAEAPPPPPAPPPAAELEASPPVVEAPLPQPPPATRSRLVPGLLSGGGAVLLGAGAVGMIFALNTKAHYDAQQSDPQGLEGGVTRSQAQIAQTVFVVSLVAAAAGLALAAGGVFGLLSPDADGALAVFPLDGGGALAATVHF